MASPDTFCAYPTASIHIFVVTKKIVIELRSISSNDKYPFSGEVGCREHVALDPQLNGVSESPKDPHNLEAPVEVSTAHTSGNPSTPEVTRRPSDSSKHIFEKLPAYKMTHIVDIMTMKKTKRSNASQIEGMAENMVSRIRFTEGKCDATLNARRIRNAFSAVSKFAVRDVMDKDITPSKATLESNLELLKETLREPFRERLK